MNPCFPVQKKVVKLNVYQISYKKSSWVKQPIGFWVAEMDGSYCWWLKSGDHQLRLVVEIPLFTTGFLHPTGGWPWDFSHHRPGELRGPGFVPWDTMKKTHPRWEFFVFHIFFGIFTPILGGNDPISREYFSNGLVQPPTSNPGWCFFLCIAHCEFPRITFTALKRGTRGNQANLYPKKKLTWQWKITINDRRYHCHVSFRECMF